MLQLLYKVDEKTDVELEKPPRQRFSSTHGSRLHARVKIRVERIKYFNMVK